MLKEQNDFWVNIEQSCLRERKKNENNRNLHTHTLSNNSIDGF